MSAQPDAYQATLTGAMQIASEAPQRRESDDGAQDDASDAAVEELPCGHARAYEEAGECMVCTRRFNTDEERRARTAAASDDLEGKL